MRCPVCGSMIKFKIIEPEKSYITDGTKLDDDDEYFNFYCSNDRDHNIETELVSKWADKIEESYREISIYRESNT